MKKIVSFTIDHLRLLRGVYVSRKDFTPSGDCITTFDIRLTEPNRMAAIAPETLHAMEHLAATFLRNHPEWGPRVVYWGPMGCCTGNYLLLQGDLNSEDILPLLIDTFRFIADYDGPVPGASPKDCGNYSFMKPGEARTEARRFLDEILLNPHAENLNYPS